MIFEEIICVHNLFEAWNEFKRGKIRKQDVQEFSLNLESNIFRLHQDLASGRWVADPYVAFYVRDPKLRHIHKASVRDRVLYQAVYRLLYKVFDPHFIFDSYSCRDDKVLHKGFKRLEFFIRKSTRNCRRTSYVLKCDVRKFFDSISHDILFDLISKKVTDKKILSLVQMILASFSKTEGIGLPLGNVTSQLFSNVYLNELDQFIKHTLKARYYARYCDDFVIVDSDIDVLKGFIAQIGEFLNTKLKLELHPNKISIRKVTRGVDFLGFISMSRHSLLRTKTKNRIFKKIDQMVIKNDREGLLSCLPSYLGILKHTQGQKIAKTIFQKIELVFVEETKHYEYIYSVINEFKKYDIIRANSKLSLKMQTKRFFVKNRKNQNIRVCIDTPILDGGISQKGLAFIMPGLGSHHNKSKFRGISQILTKRGYTVISFDPTNSFGESDGDYADATFTNYYEDLEDVIEWAKGNLNNETSANNEASASSEVSTVQYVEPFILVGHSLGGMGVTLYTEKYPERVLAIAPLAATISGKLSIEARSKEEIEKWQTLGYQEKKWSNGDIERLKWSHMEDRLKYDNLVDAQNIKVPVLMIVGENDPVTPPIHQQLLFDAIGTVGNQKEMHIIAGADHEMNALDEERQLLIFFEKWLVGKVINKV